MKNLKLHPTPENFCSLFLPNKGFSPFRSTACSADVLLVLKAIISASY